MSIFSVVFTVNGLASRSENKRMNDALFEYVTNLSSVKEFDAKN